MWKTLGDLALQDQKFFIAERCFAAIGDVATTQYLRDMNETMDKILAENPMVNRYYWLIVTQII
jgi:intraflagellar transport protein 172